MDQVSRLSDSRETNSDTKENEKEEHQAPLSIQACKQKLLRTIKLALPFQHCQAYPLCRICQSAPEQDQSLDL